MDLVPIKVTLIKGRRADGSTSVYPDFSSINGDARLGGLRVFEYIDAVGHGWHHDKVENLGTGAPNGVAAACVPRWLADAMKTLHPTRVTEVDEAAYKTFYNTRCFRGDKMNRKTTVLQGLQAERDLRASLGQDVTALNAKIMKALDPDDPEPGVTRVADSDYDAVKMRKGFTIEKTR